MVNSTRGVLRIGTSGIVVPAGKDSYPEAFKDKSTLSYYSSMLNTVEINSTFKKIPMLSTFDRWSSEVLEDFQFTLKILKEVTHVKKLDINLDNINTFVNAATNIGNKKGCLLIQFPGSITIDYSNKIEEILERLEILDQKNDWRKAVELRSATWNIRETYELLDNFKASMVLHDMPKSKNLDVTQECDFYYFRFHGPTGTYRGSYSGEFLTEQATTIRSLLTKGKDVYVYFNNTMGSAFDNAISLKAMIGK